MSTEDKIAPIIFDTYGKGSFPAALVKHLASRIDSFDGEDRERMVMLECWNFFSGGTTAEGVARRIEKALA